MSFENRKSISKKLTNGSTHIKCMNQLLFSTRTIKSRSKDARVHCVVLKVRAVPTLVDHHAVSVKQEKVQRVQSETLSCSVPVPQDPTACNIPTSFTRAFLPTRKGKAYLLRITLIRINVNVPPMSASRKHLLLN
jgi:hypothetical protein